MDNSSVASKGEKERGDVDEIEGESLCLETTPLVVALLFSSLLVLNFAREATCRPLTGLVLSLSLLSSSLSSIFRRKKEKERNIEREY